MIGSGRKSMLVDHLPKRCYSSKDMKSIDGIVIHYISAKNIDEDKPFDRNLILNIFKSYRLSAHYLIERDGTVIELVALPRIAWHAGRSRMAGRDRCNNFCVGIELVGGEGIEFTNDQMESLIHLCNWLCREYKIEISMVQGHEHVRRSWNQAHPENRGSKKIDPGPLFNWQRLYIALQTKRSEHLNGENHG